MYGTVTVLQYGWFYVQYCDCPAVRLVLCTVLWLSCSTVGFIHWTWTFCCWLLVCICEFQLVLSTSQFIPLNMPLGSAQYRRFCVTCWVSGVFVCESYQQDALFLIYLTDILDMFGTSKCSSSGVTYKQLTVFRHASYEECSGWHDHS
jgi:hypothetical protein